MTNCLTANCLTKNCLTKNCLTTNCLTTMCLMTDCLAKNCLKTNRLIKNCLFTNQLDFIKNVFKENYKKTEKRDKNLEKKRKISKEREKSQTKKKIFQERFFPEKILFSIFCPFLMLLLLIQTLLKVITLAILPFSRLLTFLQENLDKKNEKRIFF